MNEKQNQESVNSDEIISQTSRRRGRRRNFLSENIDILPSGETHTLSHFLYYGVRLYSFIIMSFNHFHSNTNSLSDCFKTIW